MTYDLFTIILLIMINVLIKINSINCCPSDVCICKWKGGKQTVECGDKFLANLPNGIDAGTQVLNFTGNRLQTIQNERFLKMDLINLQRMYLSRNQLTRIHDKAFKGLSNLVELDLSDNMLTIIPSETFQDYTSLMRLSLNNNPIRELKTNAFKHLSFLTTLELSDCQIDRIEDESFIGLDNLEWLKLDGNHISTIKGKHILPKSLHGINLHNNRWNCDCRLNDLYLWLNNYNIPQQMEVPKCKYPLRLNGRNIKLLHIDELACLPNITPSTLYLEITEGQNISLLCKIKSTPDATITWWFQGQQLQNDSSMSTSSSSSSSSSASNPSLGFTSNLHLYYYIQDGNGIGVVSSNGGGGAGSNTGDETKQSELFIYNTNVDDNGTFMCMAENLAGSTQANYTIRVIIKEELIIEQIVFPYEYIFVLIIIGAGVSGFLFVLICCCIILKCRKQRIYQRQQNQLQQHQLQQDQLGTKRKKQNQQRRDIPAMKNSTITGSITGTTIGHTAARRTSGPTSILRLHNNNINNDNINDNDNNNIIYNNNSNNNSNNNINMINSNNNNNNNNNNQIKSILQNNVFHQNDIPNLKSNGNINLSQQNVTLNYNTLQNAQHQYEKSASLTNMSNAPRLKSATASATPSVTLSFSRTSLFNKPLSIPSQSSSSSTALTAVSSTTITTSSADISIASKKPYIKSITSTNNLQDQNPDLINDTEMFTNRLIKHDVDDCGSDHGSINSFNSSSHKHQLNHHNFYQQQKQPQQKFGSQIFQKSASASASASIYYNNNNYPSSMLAPTFPKSGINKEFYKQQIHAHLNPSCFLAHEDYPVEYRLHGNVGGGGVGGGNIIQPVMSHMMQEYHLQQHQQQRDHKHLLLEQQHQNQKPINGNIQMHYYRTLPHKTKLHAAAAIPPMRYSMEAEFLNRTLTPPLPVHLPQNDIYALKKDLRYTAEGYPSQQRNMNVNASTTTSSTAATTTTTTTTPTSESSAPSKQVTFDDQQHFLPSPPEGYKSNSNLLPFSSSAPSPLPSASSIVRKNSLPSSTTIAATIQQWPTSIPGYHSQIIPIKTQHNHQLSNDLKMKQHLYATSSSALAFPATTATATIINNNNNNNNNSKPILKHCVSAQSSTVSTADEQDNNIILEVSQEKEADESDTENNNDNKNGNYNKLRHLTGPLADSPDEGYVGDSQDGSDM